MRIVLNIGIGLLQLITAFLSALVIYIAIIAWGAIIPISGEDQGEAEVEIFVQSNGVHTDVCLPVKTECYDWTTFIDTSDYSKNSSFEYIAIGWGDKGFFLDTPSWAELKFSTAVDAIFFPSPCAMHVQYKSIKPQENERVAKEKISVENYQALISYIQSSFVLKDQKPIFIVGTSYWGTDHFYEAKGNYHMFNTCNSWTNEALKSAGLKTAAFVAFPDVIMSYRK